MQEYVPSQSISNNDPIAHTMRLVQQAYLTNNAKNDRINDCESAYRAARWGMKLIQQQPEQEKQATEARLRNFIASHTSPPLTREDIDALLKNKNAPERRRLISRILHFLKLEDRMPSEELEALRAHANNLLPPIDESWIENKIQTTNNDDLPGLTRTVFGIIAYEARFTEPRKEQLRTYFSTRLSPRLGAQQTDELVKRHTFSVPQEPQLDLQGILSHKEIVPTKKPVVLKNVQVPQPPPPSRPKTPPPVNPIGECEREIRELKARRSELQRALNDGTSENKRDTKKQIDELDAQLQEKQQRRKALLHAKAPAKKKTEPTNSLSHRI